MSFIIVSDTQPIKDKLVIERETEEKLGVNIYHQRPGDKVLQPENIKIIAIDDLIAIRGDEKEIYKILKMNYKRNIYVRESVRDELGI